MPERDLLADAVVVVTGAGGGIGGAIVDTLAAHGARVVAHRRRDTGPDGGTQGGEVTWVDAELTADEAPATVVEAALEVHGRLDGLVNNAGVQDLAGFADADDALWRHTLEVNVTAPHRLTRAAAAVMEPGGSIVHIASIEGLQPAPDHAHYAVSKAALLMHTRAAALELGQAGIRVNAVSPGLIDRPGLAEDWPDGVARWTASVPLGRLGAGGDVADACTFLLSPMAGFVTGANLVVDGGASARPTW